MVVVTMLRGAVSIEIAALVWLAMVCWEEDPGMGGILSHRRKAFCCVGKVVDLEDEQKVVVGLQAASSQAFAFDVASIMRLT